MSNSVGTSRITPAPMKCFPNNDRAAGAPEAGAKTKQLSVAKALELALELRHPAHDCFYLALALSRGVCLVTGDGPFLQRARTRGFGKDAISLDNVT